MQYFPDMYILFAADSQGKTKKKQRKGKKLQKGMALTKIGLVCFVD